MQLLATVFVFAWVGCAGVVSLLLPIDGDARVMVVAMSLLALLPVILVGGVAFGLWNRRRIASHTDDALGPLGLQGKALMSLGRHYHGERDGRQVHAQFNRGPRFDLYVETPTGTRAAFLESSSVQSSVARSLGGREELDVPGTAVRGYTDDPGWVQGLLDDARTRDAIVRLASKEEPALAWQRQLHITPAGLRLLLHRVGMGALTDERVTAWYQDLVVLAEAIEARGPSPAGKQEKALERRAREEPAALSRTVVLATVGCLLAMTFGVIGLAVVIMLAAMA